MAMRLAMAGVLGLLLCVLSGAAWAARPTVVETEPAMGDASVDPETRRIVVRFDSPMNTRGGWSIVGGGETFPEFRGRPRWTNPTTLVIPVKLRPSQDYRMSFNNASFQNFRGRDGQVLVPYPLQFRTAATPGGGGDDGENGLDANDPEAFGPAQADAMATELRALIAEAYSYRDRVVEDWDSIFAENAEALRNSDNPAAFAGTASMMLAAARDKHFWLEVEGKRFATYIDPPVGNVDEATRAALVPGYERHSPFLATGRFEDGTLYAAIDGLNGSNLRAYTPYFAMIGQHGDEAPGLILDLRANGGGSELVARELAGVLIGEPAVYATNVSVWPDDPEAPEGDGGFTDVLERSFAPNFARPAFRGPVAVLTGRRTMSSAEAFTLMLRQVPGARSFGGATQGSSGNPKAYELGHGVRVFLPSWKAMTPDGAAFEGVGIAPDEPVEARPGAGQDRVLDAALSWLADGAKR